MAENPHLIDQGCPVRPCVIEQGLENCAQCEDYDGCEQLAQRLVTYEWKDIVTLRKGIDACGITAQGESEGRERIGSGAGNHVLS